ncbi:hypothetical protein PPTG_23648 [Phytophthora nicotianae INRA-310]|uniref:Uncharacterized protein n=1 Tax=Phytophthora nicotianae (strain INRA-310) TaxID=761204 RepID=W2PTE5_PHYN3|nr:hypothetical protein PPTG_23648 [Phytophthora nicotianae INRA-310]ETN04227.1 hypothetical protein PPTG_23648 [Phytophthora nicotianae INRA-310]
MATIPAADQHQRSDKLSACSHSGGSVAVRRSGAETSRLRHRWITSVHRVAKLGATSNHGHGERRRGADCRAGRTHGRSPAVRSAEEHPEAPRGSQ